MHHMNIPQFLAVDCLAEDAPNVSSQPRVQVFRWRTFECGHELLLICEMPDTGRIRTTTPITFWDKSTGEVVTESGRVYQLVGPMADDSLDMQLALMRAGLRP